jgi:Lrp/AsnC family leucine-responsive transcriptional regulator
MAAGLSIENRTMDAEISLDAIDRRILLALQAQGRSTYDELAASVGLSASATLRRVKRLEDSAVIAGYVALRRTRACGPGADGLHQRAPDQTNRLGSAQPDGKLHRRRAGLARGGGMCAALTGEMDYLLRVLVRDMGHFSRF